MPEYIEREVLLKHKTLIPGFIGEYVSVKNIEETPTADVVEVVRCKDCEYIQFIGKTPFAVRVCTHNKGLGDNVRENDFCSYGKKKEGAEE